MANLPKLENIRDVFEKLSLDVRSLEYNTKQPHLYSPLLLRKREDFSKSLSKLFSVLVIYNFGIWFDGPLCCLNMYCLGPFYSLI